MWSLVLLIQVVAAFDVDCDIPQYESMPNEWLNKAFVVRNHHVPDSFKAEVELDTLYTKYGHLEIGIDHPASTRPPSPYWQRSTMKDYIDNHVLRFHNNSMEYKMEADYLDMTLFGPTDILLHGDGHNMIPKDVQDQYQCTTREKLFGLGVKGTGFNFHAHTQVFNHLIYGKKLWFLTDTVPSISDRTSMSLIVHDLLREREKLNLKVCILEDGDMISIPTNMYHATFNLETSFFVVCTAEGNEPRSWWLGGSGVRYPYWYKMLFEMRMALIKDQVIRFREDVFNVSTHKRFIMELLFIDTDIELSPVEQEITLLYISHNDGVVHMSYRKTKEMRGTTWYVTTKEAKGIPNQKFIRKLAQEWQTDKYVNRFYTIDPNRVKKLINYF